MKLSRTSHYAVVALVHLARQGGKAVASHDIARAEALPERFLLKVLYPVVRAGVLHSVRDLIPSSSGIPRKWEAVID